MSEAATQEVVQEEKADRPKVNKAMRPLFGEIARLSSALSIARAACYEGNPVKAKRALVLLGGQVSGAVELADLLSPQDE